MKLSHISIALCLCLGVTLTVGLPSTPTSDLKSLSGLSEENICQDRRYRKRVLKLIKETPFAGLFRDVKKQTQFEASGVAAVRGKYYVIFDSSYAIGMVDDTFRFRGTDNKLIGDPGDESQFEGIAYVPENDTFLLLHEALLHTDQSYYPHITTAKINANNTDYEILQKCRVDFRITSANKGFESILYLHTLDGEAYMMGLCEGNFCEGGSRGKYPGNGRIVVSQLEVLEGACLWKPIKVINIPESANFNDYSAMAINPVAGGENSKIAILSQEDAAVWIGDFDIEALDFVSEEGHIYHLPRDNHCEMVYCNAEGVQWLDNYRLLITSDKAKSYQPFWCSQHDQSIHIFALPQGWDPDAPAGSKNGEEEEGDEKEVRSRRAGSGFFGAVPDGGEWIGRANSNDILRARKASLA